MIEKKSVVVKYNSIVVGYLSYIGESIAFQYDEEWINKGFSISPFSLPLSNGVYINDKKTFDGLYGVFNDSLPDGWGYLLMARRLAKENIDYERLDPLTKLSLIGENGLGALTYEPSQAFKEECECDLDYLSEEANKILNSEENSNGLDALFLLGGSSGGSHPKAHVTHNGEEWIVKFPCRFDPREIGKKEYEVNLLAKRCGINANECELFPSKTCKGYFGAKRFDRKNGKRIHMISFSSLLEVPHTIPNLDYSVLFQTIIKLCGYEEEIKEAYKRMCFNVLIGNKDDHGKNFAFLYSEEKKKYVLTPAYDLTVTPNAYEHQMTVLGEGKPSKQDLIAIGKRFNISNNECELIISTIEEAIGKRAY